MRTIIATLVGAALVAAGVNCSKGAATGTAWARWGITKPTPAAEAKLSDAHQLLYALKLDSALAAYRDLAARYPKSAEAHLGLSMAYRYSGKRDTALTEARAALELDPDATGVLLNYADLVLPIRTGDIPGMSAAERYAESEKCNLKAAASTHPFNAHAHTGLWASYMAQGRLSDARKQLLELGRKNYYPQPLLDFAHNLLVGLEPNAILFTNGDNDTYPTWVAQAADGFRPDVTIANIALLNIPAVVRLMKDSLNLPVSFTGEEIAGLAPKPGAGGKMVIIPAQQVIENIIANAAKAGRPVYFAVTVSKEITDPYKDRLMLEGLVNRLSDGRHAAADFDRIAENLAKNYQLDWPDTLPSWPQNMSPLTLSYGPMAMSYAAGYVRLAAHYDSVGKRAEAATACPNAVQWLLRAGRTDAARAFVDEWLKRAPDDAKAKEFQRKLTKTGTAS